MSKKPITWNEFVQIKYKEEKANDAAIQLKDVLRMKSVKDEWDDIKSGKNDEYSQGHAKTMGRKKGKSKGETGSEKKTRKLSKKSRGSLSAESLSEQPSASAADIQALLAEVKMCGKCKKKVDKILKKKGMKGGCGGTCVMGGGKSA